MALPVTVPTFKTLLYSHHATFPSLSLPLNVPTPTPLPLFSLNNSKRNLILNDPHVWFGKDLTPNVQYREYTGSTVYSMAVLIMINGCGNRSDFCQFNYNLICRISDIWVYHNSIRMFFWHWTNQTNSFGLEIEPLCWFRTISPINQIGHSLFQKPINIIKDF